MRGIITTKQTRGRIVQIANGTKRQRKKYRNTYAVLCRGNNYILGRMYQESVYFQRRLERAERRNGQAQPIFAETGAGIIEPQWHGVRGMVGMFWTWHGDGSYWVGRV